MTSVNVHLREVSLSSNPFDGDHPFTTVRIADAAGNDVTLFVNAETASSACALADALREAARAYLPAARPADHSPTTEVPVPVAAEV